MLNLKMVDLESAVKFGEALMVQGTPVYMPPEMAVLASALAAAASASAGTEVPELEADPSYDMWSLGLTLYKLFTG